MITMSNSARQGKTGGLFNIPRDGIA